LPYGSTKQVFRDETNVDDILRAMPIIHLAAPQTHNNIPVFGFFKPVRHVGSGFRSCEVWALEVAFNWESPCCINRGLLRKKTPTYLAPHKNPT
jgi:hypothetical protein